MSKRTLQAFLLLRIKLISSPAVVYGPSSEARESPVNSNTRGKSNFNR